MRVERAVAGIVVIVSLVVSSSGIAQPVTSPPGPATPSGSPQCGFPPEDCAILDELFPLEYNRGAEYLAWRVIGRVVPGISPGSVFWWVLDKEGDSQFTVEVLISSPTFWNLVMDGNKGDALLKGAKGTRVPLSSGVCRPLTKVAQHFERLRSRLLSPAELVHDRDRFEILVISQTGNLSIQTSLPDRALVAWVDELRRAVAPYLETVRPGN